VRVEGPVVSPCVIASASRATRSASASRVGARPRDWLREAPPLPELSKIYTDCGRDDRRGDVHVVSTVDSPVRSRAARTWHDAPLVLVVDERSSATSSRPRSRIRSEAWLAVDVSTTRWRAPSRRASLALVRPASPPSPATAVAKKKKKKKSASIVSSRGMPGRGAARRPHGPAISPRGARRVPLAADARAPIRFHDARGAHCPRVMPRSVDCRDDARP